MIVLIWTEKCRLQRHWAGAVVWFFSRLYVIGIKDVADENRGTREVVASVIGESLEEPSSRSIWTSIRVLKPQELILTIWFGQFSLGKRIRSLVKRKSSGHLKKFFWVSNCSPIIGWLLNRWESEGQNSGYLKKVSTSLLYPFENIHFRHKIGNRMKDIKENLDAIADEQRKFSFTGGGGGQAPF